MHTFSLLSLYIYFSRKIESLRSLINIIVLQFQDAPKSLADKFEYVMHGLLYKMSEDESGPSVKVYVLAIFPFIFSSVIHFCFWFSGLSTCLLVDFNWCWRGTPLTWVNLSSIRGCFSSCERCETNRNSRGYFSCEEYHIGTLMLDQSLLLCLSWRTTTAL